jgi:hypothetical protein
VFTLPGMLVHSCYTSMLCIKYTCLRISWLVAKWSVAEVSIKLDGCRLTAKFLFIWFHQPIKSYIIHDQTCLQLTHFLCITSDLDFLNP